MSFKLKAHKTPWIVLGAAAAGSCLLLHMLLLELHLPKIIR
jgi:hypothetical protein